MHILVQKENQQGQFHITECIYFESFQIHQLATMYRFDRANHDIHLSVLFQSLPKLFSRACSVRIIVTK